MKFGLRWGKKEREKAEVEAPAPKRVKRKVRKTGSFVGIDFLSNQVRISQLSRKGKEIRLEKVAFGTIPSDIYRGGRIANIAGLAEVLAELCQQAGITGTYATVTLSGANSVVRTVSLPKMTRSQLRQTIELQLGQFIPFPPEDTVYQYQVIGESVEEEMSMVEVLIVAGRYSLITPLLKAVIQAGFQPVAVKISYLSAMSVLKRYYEDFAQAVAIVDIRDRLTDVAVVAENAFEFSRTVEMGLENILSKIGTQIGVSASDIRQKLVEGEIDLMGEKTEEAAARFTEAVQSTFQGFANEIQRSIRYYEAKSRKRIRVGRVVLIGNVTGFFNLENFVGEILAVDVILGDPLEQIDYAMADWFPPENKAQIGEIAVSLGAGIEGATPRLRKEFNLLPREYQVVKRVRNVLLGTVGVVAALLAWLYLNVIQLNQQIEAEKAILQDIKEKIAAVSAEAEQFTQEMSRVQSLAPKLRTFALLFGSQIPWPLFMEELRTIIPQNIWLSQTIGGASEKEGIDMLRLPSIQLKGQSVGLESMLRFGKRIYESEFFGEVDIDYREQEVSAPGGGPGGGPGGPAGGMGMSSRPESVASLSLSVNRQTSPQLGAEGFAGILPEQKGVGSDLFQLIYFFLKRPERRLLWNFTMKFAMDTKFIRPEQLVSQFQQIFGEVIPGAPAEQPQQPPPPGGIIGEPAPGEGGDGGTPGY